MSAPTGAQRIQLMARATARLMGRTGALLLVAQQAEAIEPAIAARAQAARVTPSGCSRRSGAAWPPTG
jgi:hypothetical protein